MQANVRHILFWGDDFGLGLADGERKHKAGTVSLEPTTVISATKNEKWVLVPQVRSLAEVLSCHTLDLNISYHRKLLVTPLQLLHNSSKVVAGVCCQVGMRLTMALFAQDFKQRLPADSNMLVTDVGLRTATPPADRFADFPELVDGQLPLGSSVAFIKVRTLCTGS